jgi:hypothetical protein
MRMLWQHTCTLEGTIFINEGARCPHCGENEDDQLAFDIFFINLMTADPDNLDQRTSDSR